MADWWLGSLPLPSNTSRFVFDLPDGTSSGLTIASALVCKAAKEGECLNDKGKPVIRPYTPVTAPDVEGKLELLIKHYKGGAFTEYIFGLKPGDSIAMKGCVTRGFLLYCRAGSRGHRPLSEVQHVLTMLSVQPDPQAPVEGASPNPRACTA